MSRFAMQRSFAPSLSGTAHRGTTGQAYGRLVMTARGLIWLKVVRSCWRACDGNEAAGERMILTDSIAALASERSRAHVPPTECTSIPSFQTYALPLDGTVLWPKGMPRLLSVSSTPC